MSRISPRFLLLSLLALAGCDVLDPAAEHAVPRVVVESYQVAGEPLQQVRLTKPSPIDSSYRTKDNGINDAVVRVNLLDQNGAVKTVHPFRRTGSGVYVPRDTATVQPGRTYRLEVVLTSSDRVVTAETSVPDTFSIVQAVDSLAYRSNSALNFRVTASNGSYDNIFMTTTTRLLPNHEEMPAKHVINEILSNYLTPFAQKLVQGTESLTGDKSYTPSSLMVNEWPPVNESSYDQYADGTTAVAIPWQNVSFYGPNQITTRVIDKNWYDFIRSHNAQQGTGSPAEIPNIIDHVDNGTGVFASYAEVEFEVYITRP